MSTLKYWLWLMTRKGVDAGSALQLLEYFSVPERIYYADETDYEPVPISGAAKQGLLDKKLDEADRILGECERLGVRILTIQDAEYPQRLKQIALPPPVLYIRGRLPRFDEEAAIAMVGARKSSEYGRRYAQRLGMELAAGGALLVSGIAEGIDAQAIRGALMGGGRVVSLLGGGTDVVYPKQHRELYEDVAAAGALISEYPPGTPTAGEHFPKRNRIISGLSLGVLAVECKRTSGTMITIRHAQDQDRDIFAVPGSLDAPMSEGTNWLIQQGAKLVTCGEDILVEYRDRFPQKLNKSLPVSTVKERLEGMVRHIRTEVRKEKEQKTEPEEKKKPVIPRRKQKSRFTDDGLAVLFALGEKSYTVDELVEQTQIPTRRVLSALTVLQIDGAVEELSGKRFASLITLEE